VELQALLLEVKVVLDVIVHALEFDSDELVEANPSECSVGEHGPLQVQLPSAGSVKVEVVSKALWVKALVA
jgi:hypothetical protein